MTFIHITRRDVRVRGSWDGWKRDYALESQTWSSHSFAQLRKREQDRKHPLGSGFKYKRSPLSLRK